MQFVVIPYEEINFPIN